MTVTKILFSTTGRIPRQTFWLAMLGIWTAYFVSAIVIRESAGILGTGSLGAGTLLVTIFRTSAPLLTYACSLAVMIKRYHDRGKSGVWVLICLVPFIGPLWALIELGFLEGKRGPTGFESVEDVMLEKDDASLSAPPIVGRRCFHCQEEITSFLGAALCARCHEPLHHRCSQEHVAARRHEDDAPKCNPPRASASASASAA